jgi:amino acid transporter
MDSSGEQGSAVRAQLGLWDAVSIIIGIVVGTGIYETPPLIYQNVSGPKAAMGVWALAGLLCLIGALCYAELASTYPRAGGDYVYLSRAYAPWVGFLFGWAHLAVILTASIGMMAYVFADYAVRVWQPFGEGPQSSFMYAALAVVVLGLVNILGLIFGKGMQNVLTAAKVLGLGGILLAAFCWPAAQTTGEGKPASGMDAFAFAMVLVFLTYGGWNDAAYVAADVRDGKRNIPRALIFGTLAIMAIYLAVNAAYLWGLGFGGVQQSKAVAADVVKPALKEGGEQTISVLVMISALGAVNGLILTGSRLSSALGKDYSVFAWLGRGNTEQGAPRGAIVVLTLLSLGLIAVVGTGAGREAINSLLSRAGLAPVRWEGRGGFETLLQCTAPVFWLFFLLTGVSLFVLRVRDRHMPRPFSVPLFPVLPLIFCATCAYMLYGAIKYAGWLGVIGGALLFVGLPLYWISPRRSGAAASWQ